MQKKQLEEQITAKIIEQMETAGANWTRPFNTIDGTPQNIITGEVYKGGNYLLAIMLADCHLLGTYKQWKSIGANVRKGEKGLHMFKYGTYEKDDPSAKDGKSQGQYFNSFCVFTANQVDNLPDWVINTVETKPDLTTAVKNADEFVKNTKAVIKNGQPCYIPSQDIIQMPLRNAFKDTESSSATSHYYSTLFHELTHWTGNAKRLDRKSHKRFADPTYAFEELIAEMGAAFLCNRLGIDTSPREDHAKYLNNWLQALKNKNDTSLILDAAKFAQKAVDHVLELQPQKLEEVA